MGMVMETATEMDMDMEMEGRDRRRMGERGGLGLGIHAHRWRRLSSRQGTALRIAIRRRDAELASHGIILMGEPSMFCARTMGVEDMCAVE